MKAKCQIATIFGDKWCISDLTGETLRLTPMLFLFYMTEDKDDIGLGTTSTEILFKVGKIEWARCQNMALSATCI